jgi:hypothetical protein
MYIQKIINLLQGLSFFQKVFCLLGGCIGFLLPIPGGLLGGIVVSVRMCNYFSMSDAIIQKDSQ